MNTPASVGKNSREKGPRPKCKKKNTGRPTTRREADVISGRRTRNATIRQVHRKETSQQERESNNKRTSPRRVKGIRKRKNTFITVILTVKNGASKKRRDQKTNI